MSCWRRSERIVELEKQLAEIKLRGIKQGLRMSEAEQREARLRKVLEDALKLLEESFAGWSTQNKRMLVYLKFVTNKLCDIGFTCTRTTCDYCSILIVVIS